MAAGDALADKGQHGDALASFNAAWRALDEPKDKQDWAVNVLAAIADCRFFLGQWNECCDAIQHAFRCGADVSNPFLRLRLGQSLYELGDLRESANWLVPVYLMEGRKPFAREDPKYLESFRSQLKAPPEGWAEGW
ncbi:MAG: hypothetical protein QM770_17955 [Tepidisphaeraceae bacterium]